MTHFSMVELEQRISFKPFNSEKEVTEFSTVFFKYWRTQAEGLQSPQSLQGPGYRPGLHKTNSNGNIF